MHQASNSNFLLTFLDNTLEDGADGLSRKVGKNYHYSLRNNLAEFSSYLLRSGSLKSLKVLATHDAAKADSQIQATGNISYRQAHVLIAVYYQT
jgi:hypothetical protein